MLRVTRINKIHYITNEIWYVSVCNRYIEIDYKNGFLIYDNAMMIKMEKHEYDEYVQLHNEIVDGKYDDMYEFKPFEETNPTTGYLEFGLDVRLNETSLFKLIIITIKKNGDDMILDKALPEIKDGYLCSSINKFRMKLTDEIEREFKIGFIKMQKMFNKKNQISYGP